MGVCACGGITKDVKQISDGNIEKGVECGQCGRYEILIVIRKREKVQKSNRKSKVKKRKRKM